MNKQQQHVTEYLEIDLFQNVLRVVLRCERGRMGNGEKCFFFSALLDVGGRYVILMLKKKISTERQIRSRLGWVCNSRDVGCFSWCFIALKRPRQLL